MIDLLSGEIMLKKIVNSDAAGGVILIIAALSALVMANSGSYAASYQTLLNYPLSLLPANSGHPQNLLFWINDLLMAVFFLYIGMEVKAELTHGSLSSVQQALFPLIAALGGMLVPGVLFWLANISHPSLQRGWAIPTATDIAFAMGILALLGPRVPIVLKAFLMALAVIDDLGAIVVIALFYSHQLNLTALILAAGLAGVLWGFNRARITVTWPYLLIGIGLWYALLISGIHATIAGVIIGLMIPAGRAEISPVHVLTHRLSPWIRWGILPLFAFANAGVSLTGIEWRELNLSLSAGVVSGLVVGKPLGITLACWLAVKTRLAQLPAGINLYDIAAIGLLCGIGFTMAVFIASLAYEQSTVLLLTEAKLGILIGSAISAILGYLVLRGRFAGRVK